MDGMIWSGIVSPVQFPVASMLFLVLSVFSLSHLVLLFTQIFQLKYMQGIHNTFDYCLLSTPVYLPVRLTVD